MLKKIILIVTFLLIPLFSFASTYTQSPIGYKNNSGSNIVYSSVQLACNPMGNPSPYGINSTTQVQSGEQWICKFNTASNGIAIVACNNGGIVTNQMCVYTDPTCVLPQVLNTTTHTCGAPPPLCVSGTLVSSGYYDGGKNPNAAFPNITCDGTCSATFSGNFPVSSSMQSDGLHYYAKGNFSKDGFQCSNNSNVSPITSIPLNDSQTATQAAQDAKKAAIEQAAKAKSLADAAASKAAAAAAASKAASDKLAVDATATQAAKDAAAATAASDAAASDAANTTASNASGTAAASLLPDLSSLNQEGTQQSISTTLKKSDATLSQIKDALTSPITDDNSLSTQKTDYDTAATDHGNKLKSIGDAGLDSHGISWSWFPSVPQGSCTPYSYSIAGHNSTLDYCPTVAKIRDIFGWILYITTAVGLFYIFTGKRED